MTTDPVVIDPAHGSPRRRYPLKTHRISGMPVVETGVTVGVISQTDIAIARSSVLSSGNWRRPPGSPHHDHPGSDRSHRDEHPASGAAR